MMDDASNLCLQSFLGSAPSLSSPLLNREGGNQELVMTACAFCIASGRWVTAVHQLTPLPRPKQKLCVVPTTAAALN